MRYLTQFLSYNVPKLFRSYCPKAILITIFGCHSKQVPNAPKRESVKSGTGTLLLWRIQTGILSFADLKIFMNMIDQFKMHNIHVSIRGDRRRAHYTMTPFLKRSKFLKNDTFTQFCPLRMTKKSRHLGESG